MTYMWPEESKMLEQIRLAPYAIALGVFMVFSGIVIYFEFPSVFLTMAQVALSQNAMASIYGILGPFRIILTIMAALMSAIGGFIIIACLWARSYYKRLYAEVHPELTAITAALENWP